MCSIEILSWMVRNLSSGPIPRTVVEFTEVAGYSKTSLVDVRKVRIRLLADAPSATPLKPGTSDFQERELRR